MTDMTADRIEQIRERARQPFAFDCVDVRVLLAEIDRLTSNVRTVQSAAKTLAAAQGSELEHRRQNASYDHKLRSEHNSLIERDAVMTAENERLLAAQTAALVERNQARVDRDKWQKAANLYSDQLTTANEREEELYSQMKHWRAAATFEKDRAERAEAERDRGLWLAVSFYIHRYLLACSFGRMDGAEKAQRHMELSDAFCFVLTGSEGHPARKDQKAIHDATQALTNNLDRIGLPSDDRSPDYDRVAKLFFTEFLALARRAIDDARQALEPKS